MHFLLSLLYRKHLLIYYYRYVVVSVLKYEKWGEVELPEMAG